MIQFVIGISMGLVCPTTSINAETAAVNSIEESTVKEFKVELDENQPATLSLMPVGGDTKQLPPPPSDDDEDDDDEEGGDSESSREGPVIIMGYPFFP